MSDSETVYSVKTKYTAEDHASRELREIKEQAERTAEATERLKEGLRMGVEILGLREIISKVGETFIGFNATVEQTKIRLSAMIGSNWKTTWRESTDAAGEMYEQLEKFAETAPVSAQEMAQFGQTVSSSVIAAGGSLKDLTKIAEEGSVASKALGQDTMTGAMTMQRMMSGMVSNRDAFGKLLLGTMGMSTQDWAKLNAATRLQKLQGALGSDTMKSASGAMTQSFSGAVSMFKDKMEVALGKVGLPLFKSITAEVISWNHWIEANPKKIEEITHRLTDGLKEAMGILRDVGSTLYPLIREAFSIVGDVFHFVEQHADLLTGVMKGLLVYKGISMASSVVSAGGGMLGGIGKQFGELGSSLSTLKEALGGIAGGGLSGLFGSLGGALTGLLGAAGPIALFGTALYGAYELLTSESKDEKEHREAAENSWSRSNEFQQARNAMIGAHLRQNEVGATGRETEGTRGSANTQIKEASKRLIESRKALIDDALKSGILEESISSDKKSRILRLKRNFNAEDNSDVQQQNAVEAAREVRDQIIQAISDDPRLGGKLTTYNKDYAAEITENLETQEKEEPKLGGKLPVNQTVNITIQQVAAKDPDRWLADLDDMVGRLGNRPRRAKSSIAAKAGAGY